MTTTATGRAQTPHPFDESDKQRSDEMITVNDLKAKYQLYKVSKLVSDRIFDRWESDIDDEDLEQFSDNAYRGMWDALDDFATSLEEFTSGQVDFATARKMAINPKFSGRLDDLMSRLTA